MSAQRDVTMLSMLRNRFYDVLLCSSFDALFPRYEDSVVLVQQFVASLSFAQVGNAM